MEIFLINSGIVMLAFVGMEVFSNLFHKYVMHGVLWSIHQTHHRKGKGFFELNDVFSFAFGLLATALVLVGVANLDERFWAGIGIMLYGLAYFIVHDIFIHRRLQWIDHSRVPYIQALRRAHKAHHKYMDKAPGEEYGLLWISKKHWHK